MLGTMRDIRLHVKLNCYSSVRNVVFDGILQNIKEDHVVNCPVYSNGPIIYRRILLDFNAKILFLDYGLECLDEFLDSQFGISHGVIF